ncbi:type IV pilus assembly protein FimV [Alcaligenes sp. SDU_A2]|uniref:type IV pilus assembly protein FimV n=1 Tax=Alcaligenes sp. SDU_A2 TaxID=3136634 RepID=UPI00311E30F3
MADSRRSLSLIGAALLAAGLLVSATAQALEIGHSRLLSRVDQPFRLDVGVRSISPAESMSLQVVPAPLAAWQAAGLQPPVDLASLRVRLERDAQGQVRRIRLSSDQPFSGRVADVLLQIRSDSGQSVHQVSVLAPAPVRVQAPVQQIRRSAPVSVVIPAAPQTKADAHSSVQRVPQGSIQVQSGDTMHALARRYAVDGVTAYQWMLAMQRSNPEAFIGHNLHRLKAGQSLQVPGRDFMLSLDDAQARRLYADQARALRLGGKVSMGRADPAQGAVQASVSGAGAADAAQDRLRLSASQAGADQRQAVQQQLRETGDRVSQLEENVSTLSRALQSQGEAAKDLVLDSVGELGLADTGRPSSAPDRNASVGPPSAAQSPTDAGPASPGPEQGKMAQAVNKAKNTVSWIQENMLAVMAIVLALIVLIVTWVLKRANSANQDIDDSPAPVSEAMVREKLEKINLDLDQPPSDEPPVRQ